jgi:hypothetical protein
MLLFPSPSFRFVADPKGRWSAQAVVHVIPRAMLCIHQWAGRLVPVYRSCGYMAGAGITDGGGGREVMRGGRGGCNFLGVAQSCWT